MKTHLSPQERLLHRQRSRAYSIHEIAHMRAAALDGHDARRIAAQIGRTEISVRARLARIAAKTREPLL